MRVFTEPITLIFLVSLLDGLSRGNETGTVLNACSLGAPNGTIHTTAGVVHRPNPSEQGKLIVKLNGSLAFNCKLHLDHFLHACKRLKCVTIYRLGDTAGPSDLQ